MERAGIRCALVSGANRSGSAGPWLTGVRVRPAAALRWVKPGAGVAAWGGGGALRDAAIAAPAGALGGGATDQEVLPATTQAYIAQGGLHHICSPGLPAMDEPALAVPA